MHTGTFRTLFVILVMGIADQLLKVKYENIIVVIIRAYYHHALQH